MEPKRKPILMKQKAYFEQKLKDRLSFLSGKGIKPPQTGKDTIVRKFEATIKAVNRRLRTIADQEKKTEELAKMKAERAAAPKKDQEGGKGEKAKKAPEEGKGKKAKAGKKAASPKAAEGGKSQKTKEAPGEGKAAVKKAEEKTGEKSADQAKPEKSS
jgi:hypothetical protein